MQGAKRRKGAFGGPHARDDAQGLRAAQEQLDDTCRRQKARPSMSVTERLLMGLLTEEDLHSRGVQLTEQETQLYQRIRHGYH